MRISLLSSHIWQEKSENNFNSQIFYILSYKISRNNRFIFWQFYSCFFSSFPACSSSCVTGADIPPGSGNVIAPVDSIQFRDDFMPRLVEYADSLMRRTPVYGLNLGDMTWVKFMGFDEKGRANFSRKDALKEMANQ